MRFIFFVIALLACLFVVYQGIVLLFYGWPGLTQMESRLIGIGLIAVALAAAYFLSSRRT
jgi:hypothetical protein